MESIRPLSSSTHDDINEFLERYDWYIMALAREKVPRDMVPPGRLDLEIDELAQITRIRLWMALAVRNIDYPKAYIRQIVQNESVNLVRKYKPILPLPVDAYGELYRGNLMVPPGEELKDPEYKFEQEEALAERVVEMVDAVSVLPPRQQLAIICSLRDRIDDLTQLIEAFRAREMEIGSIQWPDDEADLVRLKASISPARRKVAEHMGIDISEYQRRGVSDAPLSCGYEGDK